MKYSQTWPHLLCCQVDSRGSATRRTDAMFLMSALRSETHNNCTEECMHQGTTIGRPRTTIWCRCGWKLAATLPSTRRSRNSSSSEVSSAACRSYVRPVAVERSPHGAAKVSPAGGGTAGWYACLASFLYCSKRCAVSVIQEGAAGGIPRFGGMAADEVCELSVAVGSLR